MIKVFVSILLGLLLGMHALLANSQQTPEAIHKPVFVLGDKWEFEKISGAFKKSEGTTGREVVQRGANLVVENTAQNRDYDFGFGRAPAEVFMDYSHNRDKSKNYLKWPLLVGDTWDREASVGFQGGGTVLITQKVKVVGFEEVVVPAGKFRAIKLEASGIRNYSPLNRAPSVGYGNDVYWFVPDAKTYVKHTHKNQLETVTWELVRYTPGPAAQAVPDKCIKMSSEFAGTWRVDVNEEPRKRSFSLLNFKTLKDNNCIFEAKYGWEDANLSNIEAELYSFENKSFLSFVTPADNKIVVSADTPKQLTGKFQASGANKDIKFSRK